MRVSVIIPTTCELRRQASLLRAIQSLHAQQGIDVDVIVVVNGKRYDAGLLDALRARSDVRVHYQEEGSLPAAQRFGRSLVTEEYFAFLDDDDQYLPGALKIRIAPMLTDPALDVVATNGFRGELGNARYIDDGTAAINSDPFAAMIRSNWLASCGGLYRSKAIHADYFDGKTKHFEWTLLAFRILFAGHRVLFVDVPTFRVFDSPESLSKSLEYQRASAGFIEHLLSFEPPTRIQNALQRRLSAAQHDLSFQFLTLGDFKNAWRFHLKSLMGPRGWRYLPYTRRLLF